MKGNKFKNVNCLILMFYFVIISEKCNKDEVFIWYFILITWRFCGYSSYIMQLVGQIKYRQWATNQRTYSQNIYAYIKLQLHMQTCRSNSTTVQTTFKQFLHLAHDNISTCGRYWSRKVQKSKFCNISGQIVCFM